MLPHGRGVLVLKLAQGLSLKKGKGRRFRPSLSRSTTSQWNSSTGKRLVQQIGNQVLLGDRFPFLLELKG